MVIIIFVLIAFVLCSVLITSYTDYKYEIPKNSIKISYKKFVELYNKTDSSYWEFHKNYVSCDFNNLYFGYYDTLKYKTGRKKENREYDKMRYKRFIDEIQKYN